MPVHPQWVTTAFEIDGHRIVRSMGLVRGITVRSRSLVGNFVAGIQILFGGNITLYTELCERARQEAFDLMPGTRPRWARTPSSPCATTPTRSPRA